VHPRIKVCCIASVDEARLAIAHGASALGLVSAMPSGPGPIDEALIAEIAAHVPPPIATFLLTCATDAETILAQQRRCRTNTLQLVDAVPVDTLRRLRCELPGVALVQVIHVRDWAVSRRIVETAGKPVFLAGGLKPENVAEAVAQVRPFGLDLCSGIRSDGRLDATKLERFVAAAGIASSRA
jgi:phosphoribosylanthranilate isomerase